jgi:hypothetical protein
LFFARLFAWLLLCSFFFAPALRAVIVCCDGGSSGHSGGTTGGSSGPISTITTLTLSSANIAAGTVETLLAQVISGTGSSQMMVAPGTITFYDGKTVLGTAQLNSNGSSPTAGTATLRMRWDQASTTQ